MGNPENKNSSHPVICFTCDVHHRSLNMPYMPYSDKSELQVTRLFLDLLSKYCIKATLFLTAKCFTEEWNDTEALCNHPLVEIGGHNYFCFQPFFMHRIVKKLLGPYWFQYYDIAKTMQCIRKRTGKNITSWRNHMLIHKPNTEKILSQLHFRLCSDKLNPNATGPVWDKNGLYNFPINIISDYDHLYHAHRTEEKLKQSTWSDAFGSDSYYIDQWTDIVIKQITQKVNQNSTVNILIHPITMYLCDRFAGVERILKSIAGYRNCLYSELSLDRL